MYNHKTGASADFPESTAKVALKNGWTEVAEAKAPPIGGKSKAKLKADAEAGINLKADARVVEKSEFRLNEKWEAKYLENKEAIDKAKAKADGILDFEFKSPDLSKGFKTLQEVIDDETIAQMGSAGPDQESAGPLTNEQQKAYAKEKAEASMSNVREAVIKAQPIAPTASGGLSIDISSIDEAKDLNDINSILS